MRINESELRKMIDEAAAQMISELGWTTYADAARKRSLQYKDGITKGKDGRSMLNHVNDLDAAAGETLTNKYDGNSDDFVNHAGVWSNDGKQKIIANNIDKYGRIRNRVYSTDNGESDYIGRDTKTPMEKDISNYMKSRNESIDRIIDECIEKFVGR